MSSELELNEPNGSAADEAPVAAVDLATALNTAFLHGRYMVAAWHVANGRVYLFRTTNGFPTDAVPVALDLLHADLAPLAPSDPPASDAAPGASVEDGPSDTDDLVS